VVRRIDFDGAMAATRPSFAVSAALFVDRIEIRLAVFCVFSTVQWFSQFVASSKPPFFNRFAELSAAIAEADALVSVRIASAHVRAFMETLVDISMIFNLSS